MCAEENPNERPVTEPGREATPGSEGRPGEPESSAEGVSTGVGAVGGGLAGAAIGSAVAGPIGTAVGAVIGAVAGGFGGHAVGQAIDEEAEDRYWREHHTEQPYARHEDRFEEYHPAYRTGYLGHEQHHTESFEEAEPHLRSQYEASGGRLPWERAREASRAAWQRVREGKAVRVPVSEERVHVGKREVETGGVTIRKEVHTETVQTPVELRREEIVVERTGPRGSEGQPAPEGAFQEGTVHIPLKHEEPVVSKEARVVGEVEVRKQEGTETREVSETVRKEDVKVEGETERRERTDQ